ncbi:MAG TPA: hypothetical protein VM942_07245 [Acidimicrobiales bacterium]|nr:hypothetical protein [Acidimicrobiales bacterium]
MSHLIHDAGRSFIQREGRLLEQRMAAAIFEGAPTAGVVDVLRGYQNPDGGFGHGLEPDKRCPDSQAIDVEVALQAMIATGAVDHDMVGRACDFLVGIASPEGAVSLATPAIENYPRAEHWSDWTYRPGINPTAGLTGLLHGMGIEHPWVTKAAAWCWAVLEDGISEDAHAVREAFVFLEHAPDRGRADGLAPRVAEYLPQAGHYRPDPHDPAYGVTPLHIAPSPSSRWRELFPDELIEDHLDRLERDQQPDGGWAITWEPPSAASTLEYRGVMTLWALRILAAYGR